MGKDGVRISTVHSRVYDHMAVACAFDLMMLNSDDLRCKPFAERKAALRRLPKAERDGIQYVEHSEGDGDTMLEAECKLGLEGIVSKRLRLDHPKAPAAISIIDGSFVTT